MLQSPGPLCWLMEAVSDNKQLKTWLLESAADQELGHPPHEAVTLLKNNVCRLGLVSCEKGTVSVCTRAYSPSFLSLPPLPFSHTLGFSVSPRQLSFLQSEPLHLSVRLFSLARSLCIRLRVCSNVPPTHGLRLPEPTHGFPSNLLHFP